MQPAVSKNNTDTPLTQGRYQYNCTRPLVLFLGVGKTKSSYILIFHKAGSRAETQHLPPSGNSVPWVFNSMSSNCRGISEDTERFLLVSRAHLQQGSFWSISVASQVVSDPDLKSQAAQICVTLFVWDTWQETGSGRGGYDGHRSSHQPFSSFLPKSRGQRIPHLFL